MTMVTQWCCCTNNVNGGWEVYYEAEFHRQLTEVGLLPIRQRRSWPTDKHEQLFVAPRSLKGLGGLVPEEYFVSDLYVKWWISFKAHLSIAFVTVLSHTTLSIIWDIVKISFVD